MTIDTFTNLRLVRSWGLLEQSSHNLKRSANQLQSGQRINVESDCATGLSFPDSVRSRWRAGLESTPTSVARAESVEAACHALGSLEGVLSHLLRVTQLAVEGEMETSSRVAIEQDLTVIGSCLRRIQAVGRPWRVFGLQCHEGNNPPFIKPVSDQGEGGEEEEEHLE
jgi:flagellin-like hook-associated protein FlgL